jgi:TolA-binding protein
MAMFYVGESYFKEKDYKNAAIEYMKSYKKNSKGHKSAEALYKLALCFKRLSKNEECKATLDKLIRDYPNSGDILTKAKKERSSLK